MIESLLQERSALEHRLNWLGLRSTGSDRIERRIREINREVERYRVYKPPEASPVPFELVNG